MNKDSNFEDKLKYLREYDHKLNIERFGHDSLLPVSKSTVIRVVKINPNYSLQKIGDIFNISRQRVHQILAETKFIR